MRKLRILFITDTHLTAKNPNSRLDSYYVTTVKKLYEIKAIIQREKIDLVLHGGDLFHTARVSLKYAGVIANIIMSWGVPVYVVPGSHDIYGYNMSTVDQTMLGMFESTKVINILSRGKPLTFDIQGVNSYEVLIEGQEHYHDMDKGNLADYDMSFPTLDYNILVAHGMLLAKAFVPDVAFTLIKDVVTSANLVLSGHYHPGHDEIEENGTVFSNPGSALRVDATDHNKTNIPRCQILDIHENQACNGLECTRKYVEFSVAQPGDKIFDFATKQAVKQSVALLNNFKQTIQSTTALQSAATIPDMVQAIAKLTQVDAGIVTKALNYITTAQLNAEDTLPEVKGFIEKAGSIWITKVIGHNFQSWADVEVDFTKGLNVIAGETNKGKSGLMRLILWVLYNDPKGTDFIRTGETECWGKLVFSDGSSIERKRTVSSAGSYVVTDASGHTEKYDGFNNDIPIEVTNEHQMPEVYLAKDCKVRLNVASQLDKAFLISESPAIKAAAVGRLIGVQVIDDAIKTVNSDILGYNKTIKSLKKDIKERDKDLEKFANLDDMKLYIDAYEYLIDATESLEKQVDELKDYDHQYSHCRSEIARVEEELLRTPNLDAYIVDIDNGMKLLEEIEHLCFLKTELDTVRGNIVKTEDLLKTLPPTGMYDDPLAQMEALIKDTESVYGLRQERVVVYRQILSTEAKIKGQEVSSIEEALKLMEEGIEDVSKALDLYGDMNRVREDLGDAKAILQALETRHKGYLTSIEAVERKIENRLLADGMCPLCGGAVTKEHIDYIIAS